MTDRKIIVYGDSYAEQYDLTYKSWSTILSEKMNLPLLNRAVNGSSIEYSIKYFIKDALSKIIENNDIIIFIFTIVGRQHLKYQTKFPKTASTFAYGKFGKGFNPEHIKYYKDNENYIKWFEDNKDFAIYKINASSYLHMLNNYARNNINNTFMILYVDELTYYIDVPKLDNFLISDIKLGDISNSEFSSNIHFNSFTKKIGFDPRYNHLSVPNTIIFSNLIYKALKNKEPINYNNFIKNILDRDIITENDYIYYIKKGLIAYNPKVMAKLR